MNINRLEPKVRKFSAQKKKDLTQTGEIQDVSGFSDDTVRENFEMKHVASGVFEGGSQSLSGEASAGDNSISSVTDNQLDRTEERLL